MKWQLWHDEMCIKETQTEGQILLFLKKITNSADWHDINWHSYQIKEVA